MRVTEYHSKIVGHRQSQPRLMPSAILLPESDPRILELLAAAAGSVYSARTGAKKQDRQVDDLELNDMLSRMLLQRFVPFML